MHHNTWCGIVLMAVGIALAGAQLALAGRADVLRIGYLEPETLDPHLALSDQAQGMVRFLYRGLTRFAIRNGRVSTSEVEPDLAESWIEADADDLTWVFRLRRGVRFHKGFDKLTAEDVKFSFERQLQNTTPFVYAQNLAVIRAIEVINNRTVWITLKYLDPMFLLRVAGYQQGYIVSKKAVQQYGEQFRWNPIGTGPFYFKRRLKDEKIVLTAHDAYEALQRVQQASVSTRPNVREVHWFHVDHDATKLFGLQYGAFDIIRPHIMTQTVIDKVKSMGAVIDKRGPGTQWQLFLNTSLKPLDDVEIRRAIISAIDRKEIKEELWPGDLATLATSPLPPGYDGHIPVEMPAHDPESAAIMLSSIVSQRLARRVHYIPEAYEYPRVMTLVQKHLEAVDIKLPVVMVNHVTYHQHIRTNKNALVLYNATRLMHADTMLGLFYHSSQAPDPHMGNQGSNFSHYSGIDDLLAAAREATDRDAHQVLYHQAQKRLMRDAVVLPIAVVPNMSVRNPKHVRSPFDPELGEYALHYFYNYPEFFELIR